MVKIGFEGVPKPFNKSKKDKELKSTRFYKDLKPTEKIASKLGFTGT